MKSTIKVSISGIAFTLDNDAYSCLKNYLDQINKIFSQKEGGREIIEDIEVRIAELFSARIQSPEQVITLVMVNEVLAVIGSVDDIAEDGDMENAGPAMAAKPQESAKKRLYRDIDHRVIGGVCSGLGNYFGIDRVFVRLTFVLAFILFSFLSTPTFVVHFHFTGGTILLLYIILWIVMPAARTMKEKMTMRKETIMPTDPVRREEEERRLNTAHKKDFGHVLGKVVLIIVKIIAGFVLTVMAFVALTLLFALPLGLLTGNVHLGSWGMVDLAEYLRQFTFIPLWLVIVLITLVVCLPLFGLIYLIIKTLFSFKTKVRLGLIMLITWLVALFSLAGISIYIASQNPDFPYGLLSGYVENDFSETRAIAPFTHFSVTGNFEVRAIASDTNYLRLETNNKLHPYIHTDIANGTMKIYVDRKNRLLSRTKSFVYVYYNNWASLEKLQLAGGAYFYCPDTLKAPVFDARITGAGSADLVMANTRSKINMSGASKLAIVGYFDELEVKSAGAAKINADVTVRDMVIDISGAGKMTIAGEASNARFDIIGASKVAAFGLIVDTLKVRATGSSKINVQVTDYLDAKASGASFIEYKGTPVKVITTTGASKIRKKN